MVEDKLLNEAYKCIEKDLIVLAMYKEEGYDTQLIMLNLLDGNIFVHTVSEDKQSVEILNRAKNLKHKIKSEFPFYTIDKEAWSDGKLQIEVNTDPTKEQSTQIKLLNGFYFSPIDCIIGNRKYNQNTKRAIETTGVTWYCDVGTKTKPILAMIDEMIQVVPQLSNSILNIDTFNIHRVFSCFQVSEEVYSKVKAEVVESYKVLTEHIYDKIDKLRVREATLGIDDTTRYFVHRVYDWNNTFYNSDNKLDGIKVKDCLIGYIPYYKLDEEAEKLHSREDNEKIINSTYRALATVGYTQGTVIDSLESGLVQCRLGITVEDKERM